MSRNGSLRRRVSDINTSPAALLHIALDPRQEPRIRRTAINNPRLKDEDVIVHLAETTEASELAFLLELVSRPAVLAHWSESRLVLVRESVAYNPATPADRVVRLAADRDPGVRMHAALNPRLLRVTRVAIALRDPDPDVRFIVFAAMTCVEGRKVIAGNRGAQELHEAQQPR